MKKRFLGLLIMILLFCAGMAFSEGQIDPTRQQMLESLRQKEELREEAHQSGQTSMSRGGGVSVTISGNRLPCSTLTFQGSVSGASDAGELEYCWGISDEGRDPHGYIYYPQHGDLRGKSRIQYKFYSAGTYSVYLYVIRDKSYVVGYFYTEFTIEDDGKHPTLEQKVRSIVSEC